MIVRSLVLAVCFMLTSAYLARTEVTAITPARHSLRDLSMSIGKWQGTDGGPFKSDVVAKLGVADYLNRIYSSDDSHLGLYVGYHERQAAGSAIHSPMNCLPGAGWNPAERDELTMRVPTHPGSQTTRNIVVNRVLIEKGAEKQLAVYWYQSHGRVVASEYWGKLYTVLDSIKLNRTDAALVRVLVSIEGQGREPMAAAETKAVDFIQGLFPLLASHLPE